MESRKPNSFFSENSTMKIVDAIKKRLDINQNYCEQLKTLPFGKEKIKKLNQSAKETLRLSEYMRYLTLIKHKEDYLSKICTLKNHELHLEDKRNQFELGISLIQLNYKILLTQNLPYEALIIETKNLIKEIDALQLLSDEFELEYPKEKQKIADQISHWENELNKINPEIQKINEDKDFAKFLTQLFPEDKKIKTAPLLSKFSGRWKIAQDKIDSRQKVLDQLNNQVEMPVMKGLYRRNSI